MRGFSLIVILAGVLFVGYLFQRDAGQPADMDSEEATTKYVEQQVEDILQQYQKKLDKQAKEQ